MVTKPYHLTTAFRSLHLHLLSLSLWDDQVWRCSLKPLGPGAVVNTHPRVAEQVSSQHHVAGGHARPAGGPERLAQVHPRLLEESAQLLVPQLLSRGIHEGSEGHVDGSRKVPRERVCESETEGKRATMALNANSSNFTWMTQTFPDV